MTTLDEAGQHIADRLDYLTTRIVAVKGLLDLGANREPAENLALAQVAIDIRDLAVDEAAWAREALTTATDSGARALLQGYRMKTLELDAACMLMLGRVDYELAWDVCSELLEQRGQLPF